MDSFSKKNILQNHGEYCPNHLVLRTNVNLPSVITDLAPALESFTSNDTVSWNLNALHDARKNFIKAESSARIKRVLRHNVRTWQNGDKVFYKRRVFGTELGKKGNFVLIQHGSAFYRCHPCHLMKAM